MLGDANDIQDLQKSKGMFECDSSISESSSSRSSSPARTRSTPGIQGGIPFEDCAMSHRLLKIMLVDWQSRVPCLVVVFSPPWNPALVMRFSYSFGKFD